MTHACTGDILSLNSKRHKRTGAAVTQPHPVAEIGVNIVFLNSVSAVTLLWGVCSCQDSRTFN